MLNLLINTVNLYIIWVLFFLTSVLVSSRLYQFNSGLNCAVFTLAPLSLSPFPAPGSLARIWLWLSATPVPSMCPARLNSCTFRRTESHGPFCARIMQAIWFSSGLRRSKRNHFFLFVSLPPSLLNLCDCVAINMIRVYIYCVLNCCVVFHFFIYFFKKTVVVFKSFRRTRLLITLTA